MASPKLPATGINPVIFLKINLVLPDPRQGYQRFFMEVAEAILLITHRRAVISVLGICLWWVIGDP